ILARVLLAVQPPHHVRAHALERLVEVDRIPPRLVHLPALLVEHLLVREHAPVRLPPVERDRHEALRVEPESNLLAHLRDPVGREPRLPVRVVGDIRAGEARSRARGVAVLHRGLVSPAERGEVDDAGVEPGIADLGNPLTLLSAVLTANDDAVDPGAVELLESFGAAYGPLLELGARADHVETPAGARVAR